MSTFGLERFRVTRVPKILHFKHLRRHPFIDDFLQALLTILISEKMDFGASTSALISTPILAKEILNWDVVDLSIIVVFLLGCLNH